METSDKIILALDASSGRDALSLLDALGSKIRNVKIGPVLFIQEGPRFIEALQSKGYRVFLDLKLHDIPNTVSLGVRAAKKLGIWMLSIHLSGGRKMLHEAAREAEGKPLLAGITVLTSLDGAQIAEVGFSGSVEEHVNRLAQLALNTEVNALVASPKEIRMLRGLLGKDRLIITPGIRFENSPPDDQSRTMTAREAVEAGADYLVIGRPLLQATNPGTVFDGILASMEKAKKP